METEGIVAKWNSKEKIKTAAGALVVCLNVGVDPPGFVRITPCPTKHSWVDPVTAPLPRALETIGRNLQTQYERWQPRAKYRLALDPTVEQVRKVCMNLRRSAKGERVLFHYNGHGVPKPTSNGEIWVFNSHYTQYIPLSVYDLQCWLGNPVIYVLDCPSAGTIIDCVQTFMAQASREASLNSGSTPFAMPEGDPTKGTVLMAACRHGENLDTHPDFPADLFTSCLTTPVKVAMRWLLGRSLAADGKLTPDLLDSIPGLPQERKSPMGELHWIFTAVTDSIAWDVLPSHLFQKLFRQDLLVASLFRNFLLAERIMTSMGVMPISYPRLPPTYNHHLWQTWDVAAESILMQLPNLLAPEQPRDFRFTSFFADQLDAFALSLKFGSSKKAPPQQLPILLQVLLSPVHRVRALELLYEFLELGTWAVELSLSVGVFPYVLKLLQTTAVDLQQTLISIWAKLLSVDSSCQSDLCKDDGHKYFIHFLEKEEGPCDLNAKAAAVLALICHKYTQGQRMCLEANVLSTCVKLLGRGIQEVDQSYWDMLKWICLCIASVCERRPEGVSMASRMHLPEMLLDLLTAQDPEVRAAATVALASFVVPGDAAVELQHFDLVLFEHLSSASTKLVYDGSPIVRTEAAGLLSLLLQKSAHGAAFEAAMSQLQRDVDVQINNLQRHAAPASTTFQKVGLLNVPSSGTSSQRSDILRWTTHDAAQAQQGTPFEEGSSTEDLGQPIESHKQILENLCVLAMDPIREISDLGQRGLRGMHWELDFLPQNESYKLAHKLSQPESRIHGSLLGRVGSLIRRRSKSKPSHESPPATSGLSTSSGGVDLPDFQEQTQILQTRIELASRYTQRRPYKLKRYAKQRDRSTSGSMPREQHFPGMTQIAALTGAVESALHRVSAAQIQQEETTAPAVSHIFRFCRSQLANPHPKHAKHSEVQLDMDATKRPSEVPDLKDMTLSRHVINVKTGAENISCLLLDATCDRVAVTDREGTVFIHDYSTPESPEISSFHLSGVRGSEKHAVMDSVDTVALFSLDASRGLDRLLACSTDGSVRVWDACTDIEACALKSAWQAVPICAPPAFVLAPSCFDWQPSSSQVFSARPSLPGIVNQMDLECEMVVQQFAIDKTSRPAIDFLKCFKAHPTLFSVGSADGTLRLFDTRQHGFVYGTHPFQTQGPISAMTPVHTSTGEKLAVLAYGGILKLLEITQSNEMALHSLETASTVRAHSSGCTSALISHPIDPIMASATLHPVIKVWSGEGEQVSCIRPFKKYKENCQQAVTAMAFHPTNGCRFAAGGKGRICGIYELAKKPE